MTTEKMNFLQQLYIDLATKNNYTVQELKDGISGQIEASEFFLHLHYKVQNDGHLKRPIFSLSEILEDKDHPKFELEYRIFKFYEGLSKENRQLLFENYRSHLEFYDMEIPKNYDAENSRIPEYLLKYLYDNSIMFFDEFDVSDGMINSNYLLQTAKGYVNKLRVKEFEVIKNIENGF